MLPARMAIEHDGELVHAAPTLLPYASIEECAEYGEWLMHHPKIAEDIGRAMNAELMAKHHPKIFWETVLGEVAK